jgi:hypothetical protein
LPDGTNSPGDWRDFLADDQARLRFELPVARKFELGLVESAKVVDRVVDRSIDCVGYDRLVEFVIGDSKSFGCDVEAIELGERVAHGFVTALANVFDQLADRGTQPGLEDVVEPAMHQRATRFAVHVQPHLTTHHAHGDDAICRSEPGEWGILGAREGCVQVTGVRWAGLAIKERQRYPTNMARAECASGSNLSAGFRAD